MNIVRLISLVVFVLALLLLQSCGTVDVDFRINGTILSSLENEPEDLENSKEVLVVYSGDPIVFTNTSTPKADIKTYFWDVDGTEGIDDEFNDNNHFTTTINAIGVVKVKLCINNLDNCASKWLNVIGDAMPSTDPIVEFLSPTDYENINGKYYDLNVKVKNIFSQDEIKVFVNGKSRNFKYDEELGILSKKLVLAPGENKIEVQAKNGEEVVSDFVLVNFESNNSNTNSKKGLHRFSPQDSKAVLNKSILIEFPPNNLKTSKRLIDLNFRTKNIESPKDVVVLLNGSEISNIIYNKSLRTYSSQLSLSNGSNKIIVKSNDGNVMEVIKVNFEKNESILSTRAKLKPSISIVSPKTNKQNNSIVELNLKSENLNGPRDLSVTLNGVKLEGVKFDSNKKLWVVEARLKNGANIFKASVKNGVGTDEDQISLDYKAEAALSKSKKVGRKRNSFRTDCVEFDVQNYSVTITPQRELELLEYYVFSDLCGGMEVILESSNGMEKTKVTLVKGKTQIPLSDLNVLLEAGRRYTLSMKPFSNFGGCTAIDIPKLANAANCSSKLIREPEIKIDENGKSIIFDLKYVY